MKLIRSFTIFTLYKQESGSRTETARCFWADISGKSPRRRVSPRGGLPCCTCRRRRSRWGPCWSLTFWSCRWWFPGETTFQFAFQTVSCINWQFDGRWSDWGGLFPPVGRLTAPLNTQSVIYHLLSSLPRGNTPPSHQAGSSSTSSQEENVGLSDLSTRILQRTQISMLNFEILPEKYHSLPFRIVSEFRSPGIFLFWEISHTFPGDCLPAWRSKNIPRPALPAWRCFPCWPAPRPPGRTRTGSSACPSCTWPGRRWVLSLSKQILHVGQLQQLKQSPDVVRTVEIVVVQHRHFVLAAVDVFLTKNLT